MKIVILERDSMGLDIPVDRYEDFGELVCYANTVTEEEVTQRTADADIVICNKASMNEKTLRLSEKIKLICELGTGYDNCDTEYLRNRGITLCNVQNYCTDAVAQHTFTLALALAEKLRSYDDYVKSGKYSAQGRFSNFDRPFFEFAGKTWGIVGMGNIGRRVAKIAEAMGCRVIFHSVTGKSSITNYLQVDKETLLKESDILSLHCPLSELTRDFIDAQALKSMKSSAILINVARGPIVNNTHLYEALIGNEIQAAGLDVLEKEPLSADNPLSKIKDSERLIITPHMAWASMEARERLAEEIYKNIKSYLEGTPVNSVNAQI